MEVWDLYTKYREFTGMEHIRGEEMPENYFHLVVQVWIKNSKGEYLISKRSSTRPTYPLMWETVGGSVLKGETSIEGALREVKEEIGLDLFPEQAELLFTKVRGKINGSKSAYIVDVYLFEYDGNPMLQNATTDEVCECRWMKFEEIKKLFDDGQFVPTLDYFFCMHDLKEPDYKNIIGKEVFVEVDRPFGTRHPEYKDIIYPVNYGFVEGVMGGDGEEQDVYILGIDEPIRNFTGQVIAVWHRYNDSEDKWIVAPHGKNFTDEQILGDIYFQEQFFYGKLYR